ncbi:MAG TPA: TylF/MycF/NovP-related O-methyltransferase [Rhabdochlamydiaceae bacterium]|nr:TylF/MycF/NovP-related O-methyltransferase [Rhabdochlamydiaceae bacterium]
MAVEQEMTEKFNWDEVVVMPQVEPYWWAGRQVINFYPCDKYYADKEEVKKFVEMHFSAAKPIDTDAGHLRYCSDQVAIDGAYLEMGVCTGRTINFIAALNPEKVVYGFDSFEGLPSDWIRSDASVPKKTFAFKNPQILPAVLHNVRLVKGMFEETLPKFKEQSLKSTPIAFLHIDCDIYEATKTIFDILGSNLVPGSIIVFDEYYNYPGYEQHEYKAFQEFLERTGKRAKPLAFNQYFEQASFIIIERGI